MDIGLTRSSAPSRAGGHGGGGIANALTAYLDAGMFARAHAPVEMRAIARINILCTALTVFISILQRCF